MNLAHAIQAAYDADRAYEAVVDAAIKDYTSHPACLAISIANAYAAKTAADQAMDAAYRAEVQS